MPKIKLTPEQTRDIVRYVSGHSHPRFGAQRMMAERYGISQSQVSRIVKGQSRRDTTFGMSLKGYFPKR